MKSAQKHVQAQDFGRAILDLKNAAEAMPSDPEPHYQMGLAYVSAGNLPGAANEFRRTLELNPNHIPALLKFAEILISTGTLLWRCRSALPTSARCTDRIPILVP